MVYPRSARIISTDFPVAKTKINSTNGLLVNKEFDNYDLEAVLKLKKGFEYKYIDVSKKWLETLKPYEKKDVKFSVIIPNYNNELWLEKCLNSVLNQTYKNYEIIFIDDMSTDKSLEIVDKFYLKFVDTCKGNVYLVSPYGDKLAIFMNAAKLPAALLIGSKQK